MAKTCIRCGYERLETDIAPEGECPSCGVIYSKVETARGGPNADAQMRIARATVRHRQAAEAGDGAFVAFKTMYTPILVRVAFLLAFVGGMAGAIISFMQEQYLAAALSLAWIVGARLALEGIAVVFRMADDLAAVRGLLAEQSLEAARTAAKD